MRAIGDNWAAGTGDSHGIVDGSQTQHEGDRRHKPEPGDIPPEVTPGNQVFVRVVDFLAP
jgi:hypothetical protein